MPSIAAIQFPPEFHKSRVQNRYLTIYLKIGDLSALTEDDAEKAFELQCPVYDNMVPEMEAAVTALPRRLFLDREDIEMERWTLLNQGGDAEVVDGRYRWAFELSVGCEFEPEDYAAIRAAVAKVAAQTSASIGFPIEVLGAEMQVQYLEIANAPLP